MSGGGGGCGCSAVRARMSRDPAGRGHCCSIPGSLARTRHFGRGMGLLYKPEAITWSLELHILFALSVPRGLAWTRRRDGVHGRHWRRHKGLAWRTLPLVKTDRIAMVRCGDQPLMHFLPLVLEAQEGRPLHGQASGRQDELRAGAVQARRREPGCAFAEHTSCSAPLPATACPFVPAGCRASAPVSRGPAGSSEQRPSWFV